jgi:hypothetical protein
MQGESAAMDGGLPEEVSPVPTAERRPLSNFPRNHNEKEETRMKLPKTFFPTRLVLLSLALTFSASLFSWYSDTASAAVPGTDVNHTLDANFDQGTSLNVNHDAPNNDQLQLNKATTPFPFVNIAASARGTIVRIDVNTGAILGEYQTAPDGMGRNPSRTTVDQLGNVWVSNRDEWGESPASSGNYKGSVARIGLVIGGTRVNADGSLNPVGDYLAAPFQYSTCVDRDGDGKLKTSRGLGDIRPWTNTGGADADGGVSTAEDECIINYTRVTGTGTRTVAIDANNDVWVGGIGDYDHEKLSGVTGLPVPGTQINFGCGGYGGLIDGNGVLWSGPSPLLRFDPSTMTGVCLDSTTIGWAYGLGIDPNTGHIWITDNSVPQVRELNQANGATLNSYPLPGFGFSQGIAVDGNSHVWAAEGFGDEVAHFAPDPLNPGQHIFVGTVTGFGGTTGVAVDANGKIWASEYFTNGASRIDPNAGPLGGGGFPVGAIDMTVPLGSDAWPYNYSDMTGFVAIGATSPQGTWTVVQDSGVAGTAWGTITWNTESQGSEPAGTSITVAARAADTEAGLSSQAFVAVSNGVAFTLTGRFIEVQATLKAATDGTSPVLSNIRIQTTQVEVDTRRMTGGGSIPGNSRVTHGFELHCNAGQGPNNLQVNWGKGNKFHLESLTTASCSDDPSISEAQPVAGFDTYKGTGTGRYNGVAGATAEWTFTDAGEPGKNDFANIVIKDAGGTTVLSVSGNLNSGNHQAHPK